MRAGWRGFTLIELMVVIAIISLLVAIAVPNLLEAETRSRLARVKADMQSMVTALTAYSTDYNGSFPPSPADPSVSPMWQGSQQFLDNGSFALTTPVQYIANCPQSVFLASGTPPVPGAGYFFFNYRFHSVQNRSVTGSEQCLFADGAVASGAEYVLWTLGPNKGNPASTDGTIYDPTNGNVSRGRVAYFSDRRDYPDMYDFQP